MATVVSENESRVSDSERSASGELPYGNGRTDSRREHHLGDREPGSVFAHVEVSHPGSRQTSLSTIESHSFKLPARAHRSYQVR